MWIFKAWAKPVLGIVLGTCVCLVLAASLFLRKGEAICQSGNAVVTFSYRGVPRTVSEEDQKFLHDLLEQQKQDEQEADFEADHRGNVVGAKSTSKPVPKGELIINTSEIRSAQLVVNSRVVKRAELVQPKYQ